MSAIQVIEIPLGVLVAGLTNPRKEFEPVRLGELADSIGQYGVLQPILVRPDWCVGCQTRASVEERRAVALPIAAYEIVCGERRVRSSTIVGKESVPAMVRELTDQDALEIQLIENVQRHDLSLIEEAESYLKLLAMRDEAGVAMYTERSLAAKIGKSENYVRQRVQLMRLPGEDWREAYREGRVSFASLRRVSMIPSERLRGLALAEVLHPDTEVDPLNERQTKQLIATRYMASLKSVPFSLTDADLVPEVVQDGERVRGGACAGCPHFAGVFPLVKDQVPQCLNPECYQEKLDADWESKRSAALKAGHRVLSDEESAKIVDASGQLSPLTDYIDLAAQVPEEDLAGEHKRRPSWKKALAPVLEKATSKPEVVVVRDAHGAPRELVRHSQAVAAVKLYAKESGEEPVLKIGTKRTNRDEADAAAERKKKEEQRLDLHVAQEGVLELFKQVANRGAVEGFWEELLETSLAGTSQDARWYLCTTLKLDAHQSDPAGVTKALRGHFTGRPVNELIAAVLALQVAADLRWHGAKGQVFTPWAELYEVNLSEIRKRLGAEVKEKKKAKTKRKENE